MWFGGPENARKMKAGWMLGAVFLLVQGYEWVRMLQFGLTAKGSLYGASFYSIVGLHALHVAIGLAVLGITMRTTGRDRIQAASIFWMFVVCVWPIVYLLLYIM